MNDKIAGYKGTIVELVKQRDQYKKDLELSEKQLDRYKKASELACALIANLGDCPYSMLDKSPKNDGCDSCNEYLSQDFTKCWIQHFLNEAEK